MLRWMLFLTFFLMRVFEAEVEKEGNVICEEIKMYRDNPRAHVLDSIKGCLYKKPFGMFIAGTKEGVKGMTREQLFGKHRSIYIPKNSILCVVGNNDFDEVVELAEKMVVERDGEKIDVLEIATQDLKEVESRSDLHQANLALGFHFPSLGEEMRYTAEVFASILGDGMSSKLFREVREKRGLVYSVKTELDIGESYGFMIIWAGTDPGKVDEVIKICREEYAKMGEISEEELAAAKLRLLGGRKVESEGSVETAVNLILEENSGDAEDYYKYEEKVNAVSLGDIKKLAEISEFGSFSLGP